MISDTVQLNCSPANIKLNFSGENKNERIHSHSVRLNPEGKLKIEPKGQFSDINRCISHMEVKERMKDINTKAKIFLPKKSVMRVHPSTMARRKKRTSQLS